MFRKKLLRLFDLIFLGIIFVNQILKPNNLFNLHDFKYFQKNSKMFHNIKNIKRKMKKGNQKRGYC